MLRYNNDCSTRRWIGDGRAVSSMHKDHYENVMCVVRGTKVRSISPITPLERSNLLLHAHSWHNCGLTRPSMHNNTPVIRAVAPLGRALSLRKYGAQGSARIESAMADDSSHITPLSPL